MAQQNMVRLPRTFIKTDSLVLAHFYESESQIIGFLLFDNGREFRSEKIVFTLTENQSLSEAVESFAESFSSSD